MLEETITEVSERTPIWYPTMSDEEREALLANYKPEDHLTSWEKGGEALIYYPSAWRLYELRLRFPEAMLDTDIYHFNENTGLVILVAKLYVGASYEQSRLRAKAFKQGSVGKLDALQTMCEARAARNFGISPTLALDVDDTDIARIAIRSEAEHEAKRNAARDKRSKQQANGQLEQKMASMKRIAEVLQIDLPANVTLETADAFIRDHHAAYRSARSAKPAETPASGEKKAPSGQAPAQVAKEPITASTQGVPGQPASPVETHVTRRAPSEPEDLAAVPKGMMIQITDLATAQKKRITKPTNYGEARKLLAELQAAS